MPKPTFLQSILNRPSQSYQPTSSSLPRRSFSLHHNFHSVKNDMNKAARGCVTPPPVLIATPQPPALPRSSDTDDQETSDNSNGESDVFYTPNASPRNTCCENYLGAMSTLDDSVASISQEPCQDDKRVQHAEPNRQPEKVQPALSRNRSCSRSVASSSSTSSTIAISSDVSIFSHPNSSSTPPTSRATTPLSFTSSKRDGSSLNTHSLDEDTSSLSSSSRSRTRKRSSKVSSDEDWAKDVRWLVPAADSRKATSSRPKRPSSLNSPKPTSTVPTPMIQSLTPIPPTSNGRPRRSKTVGSQPGSRRVLEKRRMSAVWEEDENDEVNENIFPNRISLDSPLGNVHSHSRSTSRSNSLKRGVPRSTASSIRSGHTKDNSITSSNSRNSLSTLRTVDIPLPLAVTDGGTPSGYTSLVLPRAAYTPSSNKHYSVLFGNSDDIDITRSGLAQTTMTTISITKNAALSAGHARPRFRSLSSFANSVGGLASRSSKDLTVATPDHLLMTLPLPLSITSHTTPPNKVQSTQVLVQVYAVAVDGLDDVIVHDKAARQDSYGFVPGRSFVGRAVECGYEVNSIAKSDWVMGLMDMRKSGGLAEFIVVDKRRLTRCSKPSPSLTLEQLALLPLCGVPAHRAVRTCDHVGQGARALVLQGHESVGALAVQELVASGVEVSVQVPPIEESETELLAAIERVKGWGVRDVKSMHPLAAIESCADDEFDFVIDTVGGRDIWHACRRILHNSGQFTTLVGDSADTIPSANAQLRSSFRSLRRAFVKKDNKAIGYSWVSPITDVDLEGEDICDSLAATTRLASDGVIVPFVEPSTCVPFERAPSVFQRDKAMLSHGRTAIIRIVD